jgi:hypothetical protein
LSTKNFVDVNTNVFVHEKKGTIVFGYVLDSWHDPNGAWVGWVVTALWVIAFALSAGAPLLAYRLNRRQAPPGRIAFVIWFPAIVLIGVTVVGFMRSPP